MNRGIRYYVSVVVLLVLAIAGTTYLHSSGVDATHLKTTEDRLDDLELRITVLEATVAALADGGETSSGQSSTHTLSGAYIERPERISGNKCTNFYPTGTTVFLSDWEGEVIDTSKLGAGSVIEDGLCSQPFEIDDVPDHDGYTINFERRVAGSAYEFTLEDLRASNWDIEVRSRYRP